MRSRLKWRGGLGLVIIIMLGIPSGITIAQPWPGACCYPDGTCADDQPVDVCLSDGGYPLGAGTNCESVTCDMTKWVQPPVSAYPERVYLGWNEISDWWYGPVVADDWICNTNDPVTDVHWWGSFLEWTSPDLPPMMPTHFHILIWSNDPNSAGLPPRPGRVIHEILCYNYSVEFAGWDYDPRLDRYEACFKFEQDLLPQEYFYQSTNSGLYWITIAACYNGEPTMHPWGWKARPHYQPTRQGLSGALLVWDPIQPVLGSQFVAGDPIVFPDPNTPWDMSFELTSQSVEPTWKWVQDPELTPLGLDVMNFAFPPLPMTTWLADDWLCTSTGPINEIVVYGSWLEDRIPLNPTGTHGNFTLAILTDIPANQSPTGYSMPGEILWMGEFGPMSGRPYLADFWAEAPEQYFDPTQNVIVGPDTAVWRYSFPVDLAEPFVQEEGTIYWLAVVNWDPDENQVIDFNDLNYQYGWKTSPTHWNDNAVFSMFGDQFMLPSPPDWFELYTPPGHPTPGTVIDLAFELVGSSGEPYTKWSQMPEPFMPPDAYHGWDEYSVECMYQTAADDWRCETTDPVTDVHWWGSYIGWGQPWPPEIMPSRFVLGIWTDQPADPNDPLSFSHPATCRWVYDCTDFTYTFAGWDFDPRDPNVPPEATFFFTCDLPEDKWFWQDPNDNIYWLSIGAVYDFIDPNHPFGWKTRPRDISSTAPDDAVVMWSLPCPLAPGMQWPGGGPLWFPTPADSWDLTFVLTTEPQPVSDLVVCEPQPPTHPPDYWYDVTPGDPFGRCDFHVRVYDPNPANYTNIVYPYMPNATWNFAVHEVSPGVWWASWWDPNCANPIAGGTYRFGFTNPNNRRWGDWTTTIGGSADPHDSVFDSSANHTADPDGYGYRVHVPVPEPEHVKWAQPPPGDTLGFDAISDLWLHEPLPGIKYEQVPDPNNGGYHAHDGPGSQLIVADDWICEGGTVTDLHWWGAIEQPGSGIAGFRLSIHQTSAFVPCQPAEPADRLWMIPINQIQVMPTGQFNNVGLEIVYYSWDIPQSDWYPQQPGLTYWFDVSAYSNDANFPCLWTWQQAGTQFQINCWPVWKDIPGVPDWHVLDGANMAFRITSVDFAPREVNKVVADDFVSDGRPISAIRWWGSYWDERFAPEFPDGLFEVDGWLLSFHHNIPTPGAPACPPDIANDPPPTVIGLYFAPVEAVQIVPLDMVDCLGHPVYEYKVNLAACCLLCAQPDPRDDTFPALPDVFAETAGSAYWLDIQAVVGGRWEPGVDPSCSFFYTDHIPSNLDPNGHFWGWHTSHADVMPSALNESCTGKVYYPVPTLPPWCPDYGEWMKQPWLCPLGPLPVHQAFELITPDPNGVQACCLASASCYEVPPLDCVFLLGGKPMGPGTSCTPHPCVPCLGDANCDGFVNWRDIDFFVAGQNDNETAWRAMFTPPDPRCPFANLDCNQDNYVNWRDIDPFVSLQNTACPPPQ